MLLTRSLIIHFDLDRTSNSNHTLSVVFETEYWSKVCVLASAIAKVVYKRSRLDVRNELSEK